MFCRAVPMGLESSSAILQVTGGRKSFGHVEALKDANIALRAGQIAGLVGDNGAGKSTLVNVIGGVLALDKGVVMMKGEAVHFRTVTEARDHGIEVVHQDLGLCQQLSIYQNVFQVVTDDEHCDAVLCQASHHLVHLLRRASTERRCRLVKDSHNDPTQDQTDQGDHLALTTA